MTTDWCVCHSLLEAKDDDFGVVIWPLTYSQVQVTVDFFSCKQTNMMDLKRGGRQETKDTTLVNEVESSKFLCYNSDT